MSGEIMCQTERGFSQAGAYRWVWELLNDKVAQQVAGAHMSLGASRKNQEETLHVLPQNSCCCSQGFRQQMLVFVNVSYKDK